MRCSLPRTRLRHPANRPHRLCSPRSAAEAKASPSWHEGGVHTECCRMPRVRCLRAGLPRERHHSAEGGPVKSGGHHAGGL